MLAKFVKQMLILLHLKYYKICRKLTALINFLSNDPVIVKNATGNNEITAGW